MNAFIIALTIFAAPVNVASNEAISLSPETSIVFNNTTEKKVSADCERVRKALTTSGKIAFCGDVTAQ